MGLKIMFTKKFLSLLLAVGLAFGLSSGVFALKDSTVNVAESNTEIVNVTFYYNRLKHNTKSFLLSSLYLCA